MVPIVYVNILVLFELLFMQDYDVLTAPQDIKNNNNIYDNTSTSASNEADIYMSSWIPTIYRGEHSPTPIHASATVDRMRTPLLNFLTYDR